MHKDGKNLRFGFEDSRSSLCLCVSVVRFWFANSTRLATLEQSEFSGIMRSYEIRKILRRVAEVSWAKNSHRF
jgi:hypothetical protein